MLGLALEGGGAKGAYHMGVVKAFLEEGYEFGSITGTSIGALNGAIIAQGDFEKGYRFWEDMESSRIFDMDNIQYKKLKNREFDKETIIQLASKAKRIIEHKGIDTSKIRKVIEGIVDEDKLRESKIDFGLVTVSLSDLKPIEIYKEDIPKGKMIDYLIASANFPGFEPQKIEDKYYIDGGLYDNCPINLLARKGYSEIIAVRTLGIGIVQNIKYPDAKVTNIIPSENIGRILNFNNKHIHRNLKMGYYDAMRYIKNLKGTKYYFYNKYLNEDALFYALSLISDEKINLLGRIFGIKEMLPKRMLFERIIPKLVYMLGLSPLATYQDIIIRLFETLAEEKEVEKYVIYSFDDFIKTIKEIPIIEKLKAYEEQVKIPGIYPKKYKILKAAQEICDSIDL